jgi:hypothetical protein
MDPGLYRRVQALGADFRASGPLAEAVRHNYRLSKKEAEGIIQRGIAVASTLVDRCRAGELRFDLGLPDILGLDGGDSPSADRDLVNSRLPAGLTCDEAAATKPWR